MNERCTRVILATRDVIDGELARLRRDGAQPRALLDVGCWDGETTARYGRTLGGSSMHGVEVFAAQARAARARGIEVAECDLETQPLPWGDGTMDVIVVNQVFEHLKNVWLPMSEVARLLAPGGHLVFSVPNLASLHNRVMLAGGMQPSSIRTFGPHVRGFTFRQTRAFLEYGGYLEVVRAVGVGFYPLPLRLGNLVARAWTGASHTPVLVARRRAPVGARPPWLDRVEGEQTWYAPPEDAATSMPHP